MLLVFGILAVMVLAALTRVAIRHYRMLKDHTYSEKDVKRTFSSLGILFPLEFALICLFFNLNGLQSLLNSLFGIRLDIIIPLISENVVLLNALGIFSTVTLGSSVALSITVTVSAAAAVIKAKKEKASAHFERVALIPSVQNDTSAQYEYLQFCRILS